MRETVTTTLASTLLVLLTSGAFAQDVPANPSAFWQPLSDAEFVELVPGTGIEISTVFGDRATGPHASFIKVPAGGGIPTHNHTANTRSMVLDGPMSIPVPDNEDNPMTMLRGSSSLVPGGVNHRMICLNEDADCLFLIEQDGPFDANFMDDAMGAAARNPEAIEVPFDSSTGFQTILPGVEFRTVFGDRATEAHGTIVRVEAGSGIPAHYHTEIANGIVLNGLVEIPVPFNQTDPIAMPTGGAFSVPAMTGHEMNCVGTETCEFYLRQDGAFDFNPVPEPSCSLLLGFALVGSLSLRRRIRS